MAVKTVNVAFGPYQVLEQIGQGGMTRIFKARHRETEQTVAIKIGWKYTGLGQQFLKRFQYEFDMGKKLHHPHLVEVFDHGSDGTVPYLAMELVDGPSLEQYITDKGRLTEKEIIRIGVHVADALNCIHQQKLVHRDVKPAKVLLRFDGETKLTNLSVVKNHDRGGVQTNHRRAMEELFFTAPESSDKAASNDPRVDIYSLGVTLYMALTGELPFVKKGQLAQIKKFLNPTEIVPDLNPRLDLAIRTALQTDPNKRPANCQEFIKLLTGRDDFSLPKEVVSPSRAPVGAVKVNRAKEGQDERRIMVRYQVGDYEANCQPFSGAQHGEWKGKMQDISLSGLSIKVHRRFEIGTLLQVNAPGEHGGTLIVKVRRVVELAPRTWLLGCSFLRPLDPEELNNLLAQAR